MESRRKSKSENQLVLDSLEDFLASIRLESFTESDYNPGFLEQASLDLAVRTASFCAPYYSGFNSLFKGFFRGLDNHEELNSSLKTMLKDEYLMSVLSKLLEKWISVNIEKGYNSIEDSEKQDFFLKLIHNCLFLLNLSAIDISSKKRESNEFDAREFLNLRDLEFVCSRIAKKLNSMTIEEFWSVKDASDYFLDSYGSEEKIKVFEFVFYSELSPIVDKNEKAKYSSLGAILFRVEAVNDGLDNLSWDSIFNLYEGLLK